MFIAQKSDALGAVTSSLCLIHCIVTPFLFIAQVHSKGCCEPVPLWWQSVDYFFLIISFFAVYRSTQTTSSTWIKPPLWGSWFLLFTVIINEKLKWLPLPEAAIYVPAFLLVILHLYNQRNCQCTTTKCCVNEK